MKTSCRRKRDRERLPARLSVVSERLDGDRVSPEAYKRRDSNRDRASPIVGFIRERERDASVARCVDGE